MIWRCLACAHEFEQEDIEVKKEDDLTCPACSSDKIEPYSGNF